MPVEAKVSPNAAGLNAAPAQAVEGSIAVPAGSNVALNVAPEAVAGYGREGADLLVHLKSGEIVRITNFYVDPTKVSHLLLVNEDGLVSAEVGQATGGALSSATYAPIDATAGFSAPAAGGAAGAGAGASAGAAAAGAGAGGALGAGTLIPLAVLGGSGLAVAAAGGGGGEDDRPVTPPDTTAPSAASSLAINAAGDRLTGSAEAGATVNVDVDGNGTIDYSATVGANGTFTVTLAPPLVDGETVRVTVRDAAGNVGPAASVVAPDTTAPAPAQHVAISSDGTGLSGTGEPGGTVSVDVDGDGDADYTAQIAADGTFTITFTTPIDNGQEIDVTVTDPAGNSSEPVVVTAPDLSPTPATAPVLAPTNGTVLSGTALSGVAVVLSDAGGNTIGQATIGAGGAWSFTPIAPLPDGTVVSAVAVNAIGEAGPSASVTVDAVAPAAPTITPPAGGSVSGTAEPGSTVLLTDGSGNAVGQATVALDGTWTFTPATPFADGTLLHAAARDAAGNTGPQATATVDASAPGAPTIDPTDGTVLSGTAEAGATVTLTDGAGNPVAQVTANGSGDWSFTPIQPLSDGTVIVATARDAVGNTGPQATATIDATAPAAPVIAPTNGSVITGTSEPGATVTLVDGGGDPIGQVTADANGDWTFTPGSSLPHGTVVHAFAQDAAGNASPQASATIDAVSPPAPTIAPSSGATFSGTSEPGSTVTLTDGSGNPIGQVVGGNDGAWGFTPVTPLPHGTVVHAVAQDAAGNVSPQATTTVDSVAPPAPVIDASDGSEITGTAEAGARVILTDGNGNSIGEAVANGSGDWAYVPGSALANGTTVNAVAQDAAGNTSASSSRTVDATPPASPTIDPTNGSEVTGTAEPNSTVILMDGTGNSFARGIIPDLGVPIGETTTDATGHWSFTPLLPLPDGTVVIAISVDAAGNVSGPVATTVDGVAPVAPTIDFTAGLVLAGTAEAGATVLLTNGLGAAIGETRADGSGHWTFTPSVPLPNGLVVKAVAVDDAGNPSPAASTIVDSLIPAAPVIHASNGITLTGTAEPHSTVILTNGLGAPIGQATVDPSGHWSFTPLSPLPNATVVLAVAQDAAGNVSTPAVIATDSVAPSSPLLTLSPDGELLSGLAEANSQLSIVIDGDVAHPIVITVGPAGTFFLPFLPPLVAGESISATALDAAGNQSLPGTLIAPDIAPPTIALPEAQEGWINAAEAADGIQVEVFLRPTMQVGQVLTAQFDGQNGYQVQATHVISASDLALGSAVLSIVPTGGMGPLPEGASAITASVGAGVASTPEAFTIDTTPPATPVLSLTHSLLTISAEPGTALTVDVDLGGVSAKALLTADNSGLASLNLLTDLDIDLGWNQLLTAQVSVVGEDAAGNQSNVATLPILSNLEQPVTIGNFAVDASLNPLNPRLGITGTTEPDSSVVIRVITPVLNVELLPIAADSSGHFALNLLSPTILAQLGLNITDILNLGAQISLNLVATDTQGHESASYGLDLAPAGLSLNIGQIDVNGTTSDDVMAGTNGSAEHINSGSGNDLIFNAGTGDHVAASNGDDTIQITAPNFVTVDGGAGFDTLLLANGIDVDYNAPGVGTLTNIERIDLGRGDSGSVLTLTASEVDAITDAGNTLQITGESNDVLNVVGAVDTGTTQLHGGIVYDVYTFGANIVLVEDNTVQVVV